MSESNLNAPFRVGLTGGIATGKSTVAGRFRSLGIVVIDADEVARAVVEPGTPGLEAVIRHFGRELRTPEGMLDRRALRARVFADAAARHELESLLHPLIRNEMERLAGLAPGPYLVMAIPLLVESGASHRVDRVLVVDVDESTQLARVQARDGSSRDEARAIIAAQASRERRLQAADDIIVNDGTIQNLELAVDRLHARYLSLRERP